MKYINLLIIRAHSSVGQSPPLITELSQVRVLVGPPIIMKSVLQIVIVFFAGILIAQILYSFGLSIDVSMMGGTAGILALAFLVTKQNNKKNKQYIYNYFKSSKVSPFKFAGTATSIILGLDKFKLSIILAYSSAEPT